MWKGSDSGVKVGGGSWLDRFRVVVPVVIGARVVVGFLKPGSLGLSEALSCIGFDGGLIAGRKGASICLMY